MIEGAFPFEGGLRRKTRNAVTYLRKPGLDKASIGPMHALPLEQSVFLSTHFTGRREKVVMKIWVESPAPGRRHRAEEVGKCIVHQPSSDAARPYY